MSSSYITKIQYPYSDSWDKTKQHVTFTLNNIHYAMANSIRRSMISLVPTCAFKSEPYELNTIKITRNDSKLNNEIIKQRLSKIPINVPIPEDFNVDDYLFILDVENTTHNIRLVTTEDFKIKRIDSNKFLTKDEAKKLFPPDPVSGEFIPIVRLVPVHYTNLNHDPDVSESIMSSIKIPSSKSVGISITAKAVISDGSDNAGFSPVAVSTYGNTIDVEKARLAEKEFILSNQELARSQDLTPESDEVLSRRFNINQIQRHFKTDEYDEPNCFDFIIESVGVIPPLIILERGCIKLIEQIKNFITNIETNNENEVIIKPNAKLGNNSYDIIVMNADDTLGNIIQTHCSRMFADYSIPLEDRTCSVITYHKVHPLKKEIRFSIKPLNNESIEEHCKNNIIKGSKYVIKELLDIVKELRDTSAYVKEVKTIT